jgi:2-iminoacetate synthase ThiH
MTEKRPIPYWTPDRLADPAAKRELLDQVMRDFGMTEAEAIKAMKEAGMDMAVEAAGERDELHPQQRAALDDQLMSDFEFTEAELIEALRQAGVEV